MNRGTAGFLLWLVGACITLGFDVPPYHPEMYVGTALSLVGAWMLVY